MPLFYQQEKAAVLDLLQTAESGLSLNEVQQRVAQHGRNVLTVAKKISPWQLYLNQFKNTMTSILLVAVAAIVFVYYFGDKDPSDLIEAGLIFAIVLLITLLGFFQEYRAEKAIESLKKLLAFTITVRREGKELQVAVADLVPGDIVFLEEGLKVPADIRLLSVSSLQVNEASLTGEAEAVFKQTQALRGIKPIADQLNMVFSGTTVVSGRGIGVVTATGMQTEIGKIARDVAAAPEEISPLQRQLGVVGQRIGLVIVGICGAVFLYIGFFAQNFLQLPFFERLIQSFIAAVALAVAAIPEGLPAVVTIALALGTQRMLKRKSLIRRLTSVETLGAVDVICSDKTGTLTKGEMSVGKLWYQQKLYEVKDNGEAISQNGKEVTAEHLETLLRAGRLCNNARWEKNTAVGDPTEVALLLCAAKSGNTDSFRRVLEIPFTSERKTMTVVVEHAGRYQVIMKGAPEVVVEHCPALSAAERKHILQQTDLFAGEALRTLAFAQITLSEQEFNKLQDHPQRLERSLTFVGLQALSDPPRNDVKELIATCQAGGIRVCMITGDHQTTAQAVAREIGITGDVLSGEAIDQLSAGELKQVVKHVSIYARVTPHSKMRIVQALQANGHIVAMTGDGVNDAPALKKADMGIAMGKTGTDVAKEAADMVLLDETFSTIVASIEEGRGIYHNIRKFVMYLLSSNIAEVCIIFFGIFIFQELPLSASMLLWINVVTDGIPAVALGIDPVEKGIMRYQPHLFQQQILSARRWGEMFLLGVLMSVAILTLFFLTLPEGLQAAQSVVFTAVVCLELVMLFLVRQAYHIPFFSNKWLSVSLVITLLLQWLLLSVPFLRSIFGIRQLQFHEWLLILLASVWFFSAGKLMQRVLTFAERRNIPQAATQGTS